ncbi:MAG: N-6 DNA methylase [Akkermansiaceae bacterium]
MESGRPARHIIELMVEMTDPQPGDTICDPACGTCGFLVTAAQFMAAKHGTTVFKDAASRRRFSEATFFGYDFDTTMLRIGSMNMLLHGIENPDIRYKDSLEETHAADSAQYSLILANPRHRRRADSHPSDARG